MTEPASPREYSISELEEATGVSRRTIHYYIARGLVPPPDGAGLAARYGEAHLLRLRLIDVLKRANLRLEGVREMLDAMSPEDLRRLVGYAQEHPVRGEEGLRAWMVRAAAQSQVSPGPPVVMPAPGSPGFLALTAAPPPVQHLDVLASRVDHLLRDSDLPARYQLRRQELVAGLERYPEEATTWRRLRVLPDLEIHFRPGDTRFTMRLQRVVEFIRQTFGEEVRREGPEGREGPK